MPCAPHRGGMASLEPPEPVAADRRVRELSVRLPVDLHLRLHERKLTDGVTITEMVEAALRDYFARATP